MVIDKPNNVKAYNYFEEELDVERFKCNFRLTDLTREALYDTDILVFTE